MTAPSLPQYGSSFWNNIQTKHEKYRLGLLFISLPFSFLSSLFLTPWWVSTDSASVPLFPHAEIKWPALGRSKFNQTISVFCVLHYLLCHLSLSHTHTNDRPADNPLRCSAWRFSVSVRSWGLSESVWRVVCRQSVALHYTEAVGWWVIAWKTVQAGAYGC